jgi:hypothetical protein
MSPLPDKNVRNLPRLDTAAAEKVKRAAAAPTGRDAADGLKPGVERWPVKTGTDADVSKVGQNLVNGEPLGQGVVQTTLEEMLTLPRAADMPPVNDSFGTDSLYQNHRAAPTETTIWELTATVVEVRLEADGDYHLVLQGVSGQEMIGEIPNPDPAFVGNPTWLAEIKNARDAMDQKLGGPLEPEGFKRADMAPPKQERGQRAPVKSEEIGTQPMTPVNASATITGVGFFDSNHGQTGVAPTAIEIHPIFSIEFL